MLVVEYFIFQRITYLFDINYAFTSRTQKIKSLRRRLTLLLSSPARLVSITLYATLFVTRAEHFILPHLVPC